VRPSKRSIVRAGFLIAIHVAIVAHIAQWKLSGTTLSPVEPSEAASTIELGIINAGFVLFALLILSTLVLGRFFCGWACHVVAYQDLCAWGLGKIGLRPRPLRSRLLAFVPLYAALHMFVWPSVSRAIAGQGLPPLRGFGLETYDLWERFPGFWIGALTFIVDGALVVWWFGAKGFCTYGCPYGAIFSAADHAAPGKIRVTDACEGCGHCTATCTSNVRVHEEVRLYKAVVDPGCMKCLDCVSVCPKGALYFGFGPPTLATPKPKKRAARAYDFSWGEELAMAGVFAAGLFAFRGVYDAVPFLLAIGLALLGALAAIVLWRCARGRDILLQHWQLVRDGRRTRAGLVAAAVALLFLGFGAHCAAVQWETRDAEGWMRAAQQAPFESPEHAAARERAASHLSRAESLGLFPNAKIQLMFAAVANDRRDAAETARRLRAAVSIDPRLTEAWVRLAGLSLAAGDAAGAQSILEEALARNPNNRELRGRLEALRGR
jgi:ferredoxin